MFGRGQPRLDLARQHAAGLQPPLRLESDAEVAVFHRVHQYLRQAEGQAVSGGGDRRQGDGKILRFLRGAEAEAPVAQQADGVGT